VDETTPTACTDGKNEKYGRAFCDKLSDAELRFLRMHEVFHKMRRDLQVWQHLFKQDADCIGRACDYVNNLTLVTIDAGRNFIVMPKGGLIDERFRGMHAGQVYAILKKEKEEKGKDKPDEGDEGDEGGEGGQPGKPSTSNPQDGEGGGFDSHDWEAAGKLGAEEIAEQARDIDDAIRQGAMYAGRTGSGGKRLVEDLLTPQVAWEDVLRDFLQTIVAGRDYSSWRKVHRRSIASGDYLPSGVTEEIGEIVIGIDTSGSIDTKFLTIFLSEVAGICEALHPDRVRLLYWDTTVCRAEVYETADLGSLIRTTKPEGGGGTDPRCVTQYMEQHNIKPECVVMLTDGYVGSWGDAWPAPVLWCVLNNTSATPANGQVVHITI
jgi:predicted metal-dependent peptidase